MPGLSPALAQQLQTTITAWNANQAQFADWLGGVVEGGPNHDGRYPLTNALGVETLVSCPAAIIDAVSGPAAQAEIAKLAADASASASASSATSADASKVLAEAAKNAAITARVQAQTAQSNAANHEANARYWAELAQGHGADVEAAVETITELAQQTAADAVTAEAAAGSAADSAELAAHFEPNNFDKKSDPIAANRITGTISISNLPALPGADAYFSTGGFADISAADQTAIKTGDYVTLSDGRRWQYRGGTKTAQASYVYITDDTPDWNTLANLPTTFLPSAHSHSHTDINGFNWSNLNSKPTTFTPSAHTHAWGDITGIPSTFTPSTHAHAMADITGLTAALDLKAPKANASFSTAISVNGPVGAHSFAANHSLFYPDGNHTVIKTGAAGSEKYWRFDADGTLYSLNGNIYSNFNMQAMGSLIVGASNGANRVNVEKGWLELRNDGYGPYVDFSLDASTDFHARISVPKSDGRLWLSHGGGGSVIVGPTIEANSNNGSQAGSIITHAGGEQVMAKQLTFPSIANPQDSGAGAMLEVRGDGAAGTGAWMKFHRPGQYGTYFGMFGDGEFGYGGWSAGGTIRKFWTEKNFDPLTRMERYNDGWVQTRDANDRFYFASNGRSYYKSKDGHEWRNGTDANIGSIDNGGNLRVPGVVECGDRVQLRGTNPTIVLRDTDHRSAMIHVNANKFYVLRGAGTDNDGWASTGGGWPLEIDLENNNATFGANIYTGIDQWFRVRGTNNGIYWESWGGGWFMQDSSWMRAYNDKNIVTGGQVQMGSFTVTSDRRLKTDIVPIPLAQASQIIDDTNVYEFTKNGKRMFGMIAQEAQEVAPILVSEGADLHEDGDAILSLDQTGYIPVMIAELRSLRQRVALLEGTIH